MKAIIVVNLFVMAIFSSAFGQEMKDMNNGGAFSLGVRTTVNAFSDEGSGLGTGGQFRVRFSDRINTDWFLDYISINIRDRAKSEYLHIGWSVLYYFGKDPGSNPKMQPYLLAGHCFDYNKKSLISLPDVNKDRWGSAVQAGLGTHVNLARNFDISINCQYMIHLTREIEFIDNGIFSGFKEQEDNTLEGHLLATFSVNYKIFHLWKK